MERLTSQNVDYLKKGDLLLVDMGYDDTPQMLKVFPYLKTGSVFKFERLDEVNQIRLIGHAGSFAKHRFLLLDFNVGDIYYSAEGKELIIDSIDEKGIKCELDLCNEELGNMTFPYYVTPEELEKDWYKYEAK